MGDWDYYNNLMHELRQGMELAKQLQISLCSSQEISHELLIQKIIATFERALKMVNMKLGLVGQPSSSSQGLIAMPMSQSPRSPRSENSDPDNGSSPKKRKSTIPTWTKHVRVNLGMGVEGPLDDGYSWRKYGQKVIHGAKYPRGYYRCVQRNVHGCMATKQVQRSDQDPTIFEINYRGNHTCTIMSSSMVPPSSSTPQDQSSSLAASSSSHHYFPSTTSAMVDHNNNFAAENLGFPSSNYVSPATSDTTYFMVSPNLAGSGVHEINDMISAATSPTLASLEFPFDQFHTLDGQNFTFDNPPFS